MTQEEDAGFCKPDAEQLRVCSSAEHWSTWKKGLGGLCPGTCGAGILYEGTQQEPARGCFSPPLLPPVWSSTVLPFDVADSFAYWWPFPSLKTQLVMCCPPQTLLAVVPERLGVAEGDRGCACVSGAAGRSA